MSARHISLTGVWKRRAWLLAETLILAVLLLAAYLARGGRVMMHIDESHWISTSKAWEPFIAGDRSSALWAESYDTLIAPPGTRYVVGIGRALGGYGPHELPTPWTFTASAEENTAAGAMPSQDLLWWSRLPMVVLSVLACLASFLLMRSLFGAPAAYLGLGLLAINPWIGENAVRAMAEAPLLCSLLLVVVAGVRLTMLANRGSAMPVQLLWLGLAGVGAGLAGSFKPNGLTALAGIVAVWVLVVAFGQHHSPPPERIATVLLGIVLATGLAAVTLLVLNPFLDPDPLGRYLKMIQQRAQEIRGQLLLRSWWPINGLGDRSKFIFSYVFQQAVMVHHPVAGVASLALWLVGFGYVLRGVYASWRRKLVYPAGAALLVAITAAGPMLSTPLRWDRYMFLPVWFSALLVALGTTVCFQWLLGALWKQRGWRAGVQLDTTPGEPGAGS